MRIVIITGMSGSGKSTAVRALEDDGFFCLDNLPMQLLQPFIELAGNSRDPINDVALVVDIRARDFLRGREDLFQELRDAGHRVEILFLDASDQVLIRRFSETRRRHPALEGGTVPEGIRFEREQLAGLYRLATIIIDTSELNVHQLRDLVMRRIHEGDSGREMVINLQSFGFRYGLPPESDLVLDVRFLPNPYFVPELKQYSGLEPQVRDFVLGQDATREFLERFRGLLDFLIPGFEREGKSYLTISIGCTGGRHRSVAITQALGDYLCAGKIACRVSHRDIDRG
jgi:UPF0042 nucleotide-binding protein